MGVLILKTSPNVLPIAILSTLNHILVQDFVNVGNGGRLLFYLKTNKQNNAFPFPTELIDLKIAPPP